MTASAAPASYIDEFRKGFGQNVLASLVVFLVALPLCMGIAIASGAPPVTGLITGIVGGIIVGFFAGSPLLVSGPAAGLAVLVYELIQQYGLIALGPVVLLSGVIQLAAGLARIGVWFRVVSPAVVSGMLAGIGILIIASQLHVMFDALPMPHGLQNFGKFPERLFTAISDGVGIAAALLGLATIVIMLAWEKLRPHALRHIPGALLAVVTVTLVAQFGNLDVNRINLPENLFAAVKVPGPDLLALFAVPGIWVSALVFAFIASAETLLSAAAVDRMHNGARTKYDKELVAQGVGNTICGLLGALPMTGVIVRSAANVQAGATSRLSTILHGTWMLLFVLALPWLLRMTPVAALAGILVFTGFKMINPKQMRELSQYGKGTLAVFAITAITIVATDLLVGVVTGFAISLLRLALRAASVHLSLKPNGEHSYLLRLVGSATFLAVPKLARALETVPPNTVVHLDISRLSHIDHACLVLLRDWQRTAASTGCKLVIDEETLEAKAESNGGRRAIVEALS